MPSRRPDSRTHAASRRTLCAAPLLVLAAWIAPPAPGAEPTVTTIDALAALTPSRRERALTAIRGAADSEATLLALETAATLRADARRADGVPPLFAGCLTPEEFELAAQLALARAALDGKTYRALSADFRRLTGALRDGLARAQGRGDWKKQFSHLGHWIPEWSQARDPVVRELLRRTLVDQAIRASLSSFEGPRIYGKARPTPALRAYDEYIFNLMCTADEENLLWLKEQVAQRGWFDIRRDGAAADQAASLLVQHADGDPAYQSYIARLLEPKVASGDTNARNFAFLTDRLAVRTGRPQNYGTSMECVDGEWLAPRIRNPEALDERRHAMGLEPYLEQLARGKHLCVKRRD